MVFTLLDDVYEEDTRGPHGIGHRHPDPRPPFDTVNGSRYWFGQINLVSVAWNRFFAGHRNYHQLVRCNARFTSDVMSSIDGAFDREVLVAVM